LPNKKVQRVVQAVVSKLVWHRLSIFRKVTCLI